MGGSRLTEVALERTETVTTRRVLAREQGLVLAAQVLAGAGNLAYAVVMARVLSPTAFTDLAAFLVCYLLLSLPAAGLGAAGALAPSERLRQRALFAGLGLAGFLIGGTPVVARVLDLPWSFPLLLAVAAPAAASLGLERGTLYATTQHDRAAATLVVEPIVRLVVGLALARTFGAPGAATAVVVAAYVGLAVARRAPQVPRPAVDAVRSPTMAIATFVLLAIVQNQDLLFASGTLAHGPAARFAALSTVGGIAAFGTATLPLVLLPRAGRQPHALSVALGAAVAIGGTAVVAFMVAPRPLVDLLLGARYQSIAPLVGPYVLGMALLGGARVLLADRLGRGLGRSGAWFVGCAAVAQLVLLAAFGTTPRAIAAITIGTTAGLSATLGGAALVRLPATRNAWVRMRDAAGWPAVMVTALAVMALVARLLAFRGLWVDEAISVSQAHMPFGPMLDQLASVDVHPPMHAALLWGTVRLFGDGELAVRIPSLIAGVLLVPMLYVAGRDLFDRRTGLLAAALGAVSPMAVWYSQEARMYSVYMLIAVVAVWSQAQALRRGDRRDWVLYALATAGLLWTQYFALLQVIAQQLVFAVVLWQRARRKEPLARVAKPWALALAGVIALTAPLIPFFLDQLTAYSARGAGLSGVPAQAGAAASDAATGLSVYSLIANLLWAVGGYHADGTMARLAAFWPLGMLAALLVLGRRRAPTMSALLAVGVLPLVALFAIGAQRSDLFELRYVAGVVPVLVLIGARSITALTFKKPWAAVAACTAAILLSTAALGDQQLNGRNPRLYDFRGALREVSAHAERGDLVLYNPIYLRDVVEYYVPGVAVRAANIRGAIPEDAHVFLVGSFFDKREISARTGSVLSRLREQRRLVREFRGSQVRVWEFA